jgi:hypothetical protein
MTHDICARLQDALCFVRYRLRVVGPAGRLPARYRWLPRPPTRVVFMYVLRVGSGS